MVVPGGGHVPARRPPPDVVVVFFRVAGHRAIDRLPHRLVVGFGPVHRMGNRGKSAVPVVFQGVFVVVVYLARPRNLPVLIVVENLVVMVDFVPGAGQLGAVWQRPAALAELAVFLDVDVPRPFQGGDLQIRSGAAAVHPGEQGNEGYGDDRQDLDDEQDDVGNEQRVGYPEKHF